MIFQIFYDAEDKAKKYAIEEVDYAISPFLKSKSDY